VVPSARDAHAVWRVWSGRRRRLERVPAMRQAWEVPLWPALQPGGISCPYCAKTTTESRKAPKRLRDRDKEAPTRAQLPAANIAELRNSGAEKLLRALEIRRRRAD